MSAEVPFFPPLFAQLTTSHVDLIETGLFVRVLDLVAIFNVNSSYSYLGKATFSYLLLFLSWSCSLFHIIHLHVFPPFPLGSFFFKYYFSNFIFHIISLVYYYYFFFCSFLIFIGAFSQSWPRYGRNYCNV